MGAKNFLKNCQTANYTRKKKNLNTHAQITAPETVIICPSLWPKSMGVLEKLTKIFPMCSQVWEPLEVKSTLYQVCSCQPSIQGASVLTARNVTRSGNHVINDPP